MIHNQMLLLLSLMPAYGAWLIQESGVTASLRGISVVDKNIAWASGSAGTCLRTTDGGKHWKTILIPDAAKLDFRGVHAFSADLAYLLSSGPGELSRIYKTVDGGSHWTLQKTNPEPEGFYDAIAFSDPQHGVVLGDPVNKRFTILLTSNGGNTWTSVPAAQLPAALKGEGAFAASNSCLFLEGSTGIWFGTGGPSGARVFHSTDAGSHWTVHETPIRHSGTGAGIFSLAFLNSKQGVMVGGDYSAPTETDANIAITNDSGETWTVPKSRPAGYRSAVAYIGDSRLIALGTSGTDLSIDGGITWTPIDARPWNALAFPRAVGPEGRIAVWLDPPPVHFKVQ